MSESGRVCMRAGVRESASVSVCGAEKGAVLDLTPRCVPFFCVPFFALWLTHASKVSSWTLNEAGGRPHSHLYHYETVCLSEQDFVQTHSGRKHVVASSDYAHEWSYIATRACPRARTYLHVRHRARDIELQTVENLKRVK